MEYIIILFWFLCAVFSAYIASQKNRDSASWFFIGLFFGLFALIAIASVPALLATKPVHDYTGYEDRFSKYSIEELKSMMLTYPPDSEFCLTLKSIIEKREEAAIPPVTFTANGLCYCGSCKHGVSIDYDICPVCRVKLNKTTKRISMSEFWGVCENCKVQSPKHYDICPNCKRKFADV